MALVPIISPIQFIAIKSHKSHCDHLFVALIAIHNSYIMMITSSSQFRLFIYCFVWFIWSNLCGNFFCIGRSDVFPLSYFFLASFWFFAVHSLESINSIETYFQIRFIDLSAKSRRRLDRFSSGEFVFPFWRHTADRIYLFCFTIFSRLSGIYYPNNDISTFKTVSLEFRIKSFTQYAAVFINIHRICILLNNSMRTDEFWREIELLFVFFLLLINVCVPIE